MYVLSKSDLGIIDLKSKGYNCDKKGNIINSKGIIVKGSLDRSEKPYKTIGVRYSTGKCNVKQHRFIAYIKYGNKLFDDGIVVRHLNGNSLDNSWENIVIGTQSDNMYDKLPEIRLKNSINATRKMQDLIRPLNKRLKIYEDVYSGLSYKNIMEKHKIPSKGTISYIKNKSTEYKEFCKNKNE